MTVENVGENKLMLGNGATPFTVADAVIRACPDREWLEDVVFFLNAYIERTYTSNNVQAKSDGNANLPHEIFDNLSHNMRAESEGV